MHTVARVVARFTEVGFRSVAGRGEYRPMPVSRRSSSTRAAREPKQKRCLRRADHGGEYRVTLTEMSKHI